MDIVDIDDLDGVRFECLAECIIEDIRPTGFVASRDFQNVTDDNPNALDLVARIVKPVNEALYIERQIPNRP